MNPATRLGRRISAMRATTAPPLSAAARRSCARAAIIAPRPRYHSGRRLSVRSAHIRQVAQLRRHVPCAVAEPSARPPECLRLFCATRESTAAQHRLALTALSATTAPKALRHRFRAPRERILALRVRTDAYRAQRALASHSGARATRQCRRSARQATSALNPSMALAISSS